MMKKHLQFLLILLVQSSGITAQTVWIPRDSLPSSNARVWPGVFTIGSNAYVVSGTKNGHYYSDVWRYSIINNKWQQMNDFPGVPRGSAQTFTIGNKAYLLGGYTSPYNDCNDLWEYDQAMDAWTQKNKFPGNQRTSAIAFSIGGKGYYGTGSGSSSGVLSDMWRYDPVADTWTQLNDFPGNPVGGAMVFKLYNKIYAGYGTTNFNQPQSIMYEYNPAVDTWYSLGATSFSWQSSAYFTLNTKGYVATCGLVNQPVTQDMFSYDPLTNSWTQETGFPGQARCGAMGFSIGGSGYVGFGDINNWTLRRDLYEYGPNGFTGMNEMEREGVYLYPACASDRIYLSGVKTDAPVEITDSQGRLLKKEINQDQGLDVSALSSGLYLVRISSNSTVFISRFIKE
jgi:N-acetylneuraminic acid mutarotase